MESSEQNGEARYRIILYMIQSLAPPTGTRIVYLQRTIPHPHEN